MSFSVDKYLDRQYHLTKYNCAHFVNEVWMDLTGECIVGICQAFVNGDDGEYLKRIRERQKLQQPENPCVAIMHTKHALPHAGVCFGDRVLHLTETGVQFEALSILKTYCRITYYK